MPTPTNVFLLFTATVLLCIIPGPDMLYIIARSTTQGRSAGVISCIGIALGGLLQTSAVALGLTGLFLVVPIAYDVIKYVGAVYLVYLGIRAILNREELVRGSSSVKTSLARTFWQGTFTTLLNPKVAFFYLAFLPQFVDQAHGHIPVQLLVLGLLFNFTGLAVDTSIALLASLLGTWLQQHTGAAKVIRWLTGGVFIGLGVRLAFSQRQ